MALSLIFPEIMMLCSFGQWRKARRIHAVWLERFPVTKERPDSLGLEGAFFVLMGGFLVKEGKGYKSVLTPLGFEHYVRTGQVGPTSFNRRYITDKGKASAMAKAIVLCQATWFLYQCIRRGSVGLPITILEVHVVTQVLCMFVLYFFWWKKPLSIAEPLPIIIYPEGRAPDEESPCYYYTQPDWDGSRAIDEGNTLLLPKAVGTPLEPTSSGIHETSQYEEFSREYVVTEQARSGLPNLVLKVVYDIGEYIVMRNKDRGYRQKGKGRAAAGGVMGASEGEGQGDGGDRADVEEEIDDDGMRKSARDMVVIGVFLASNGAMHIPAWSIRFPTEIEAWLWRAACIAIVVSAVIFTCIVAVTNYDKRFLRAMWETRFLNQSVWSKVFSRIHAGRQDIFKQWEEKTITEKRGPIQRIIRWPLYWLERIMFEVFWILIFVYLLCTVFLLVEAIISMRHVPRRTYVTPRDLDGGYWPHFV